MAKFTLKKTLVKVTEDEGNSFAIRGLSVKDIAQIMQLYASVFHGVVDKFSNGNPETMTPDDVAVAGSELAVLLVERSPELVAHIIALAADDLESSDEYARLPIGVQIEALSAIAIATVLSDGGGFEMLSALGRGIMMPKGMKSLAGR